MNIPNADNLLEDVISALVKASPSLTVTGMTILGITLHQWVYVVTILYTLVAIATLIKRFWMKKDD